jgi:hypothetical protein
MEFTIGISQYTWNNTYDVILKKKGYHGKKRTERKIYT